MSYSFTRTGAQIEEIHNTVDDLQNIISNENLISDHLFESPGTVATPPDSTPRDYNIGDELFKGKFALSALTGVTYIDGKLNGTGQLYTDVAKKGKQEESTSEYSASIAGSDGSPIDSGASFVDNGNSWRVTFDMSDTFSVKLEQGKDSTAHSSLSSLVASSDLEQVNPLTTNNGRFRTGMVLAEGIGLPSGDTYSSDEEFLFDIFSGSGSNFAQGVTVTDGGITHTGGIIYLSQNLGSGTEILNESQLTLYIVDNLDSKYWFKDGDTGVSISLLSGVAKFEISSDVYAELSGSSIKQAFGQVEVGVVANVNEEDTRWLVGRPGSVIFEINGGLNVGVNQRYEVDIATDIGADYAGKDINIIAQVYNNTGAGEVGWGESNFQSLSATSKWGVNAGDINGKIIVKTGANGIIPFEDDNAGIFGQGNNSSMACPCRIKVWKQK